MSGLSDTTRFSEDDLLRKVAGLIAKAEGTDNEHERDAFHAKARELMTRYALSEEALLSARGTRTAAEKPVMVEFEFSSTDQNAAGKRALLNVIAKHNHCRFICYANRRYENMNRDGNSGVASQWGAVVGFRADIAFVRLLYVSLLAQAAVEGARDFSAGGYDKKSRSRFLTAYFLSFAARISERFAAQDADLDSGSHAIVLARDSRVDDAFREHFPSTSLSKNRAHGHVAGAWLGRAAGDRANIAAPSAPLPTQRKELG